MDGKPRRDFKIRATRGRCVASTSCSVAVQAHREDGEAGTAPVPTALVGEPLLVPPPSDGRTGAAPAGWSPRDAPCRHRYCSQGVARWPAGGGGTVPIVGPRMVTHLERGPFTCGVAQRERWPSSVTYQDHHVKRREIRKAIRISVPPATELSENGGMGGRWRLLPNGISTGCVTTLTEREPIPFAEARTRAPLHYEQGSADADIP